MKKTRKMIMYTRSTCFGTLGLSRWYSTQDNGKSSVNNNTTGVKGLEMSGVSTWSSGSLTNDGFTTIAFETMSELYRDYKIGDNLEPGNCITTSTIRKIMDIKLEHPNDFGFRSNSEFHQAMIEYVLVYNMDLLEQPAITYLKNNRVYYNYYSPFERHIEKLLDVYGSKKIAGLNITLTEFINTFKLPSLFMNSVYIITKEMRKNYPTLIEVNMAIGDFLMTLHSLLTKGEINKDSFEKDAQYSIGSIISDVLISLNIIDKKIKNAETESDIRSEVVILPTKDYTDVIEIVKCGAVNLPMICPPNKWDKVRCGGYFMNQIVKTPLFSTKYDHRVKFSNEYLDSINKIQNIKFTVNHDLLNYIIKRKDVPGSLVHQLLSEGSEEDKNINKQTLDIAILYQDQIFYYPIQVDWRGRIYYNSAFFSPQMGDLGRSLISLAVSSVFDQSSHSYFIQYGYNLGNFGESKMEYEKILKIITDNEENIINLDPKIFKGVSKPFLLLGWCLEYKEIFVHGKKVSNYPIYIDATCSGLQHLSMIVKDEFLMALVNINVKSTKPNDVYNFVCSILNSQLDYDFKFTRDDVKKLVMTIPYNITRYGSRGYLINRFTEIWENGLPYYCYPGSNMKLGSEDITKIINIIFKAIEDKFPDLMMLVKYLGNVAKFYNKLNSPIEWITPMRVSIEQFYNKFDSVRIRNIFSFRGERYTLAIKTEKLDSKKQALAFMPNLIHSMDVSNITLAMESLVKSNIPAIFIHDSFGTTLGCIDQLKMIIINEFLKMYGDRSLIDEIHKTLLFKAVILGFEMNHNCTEVYNHETKVRIKVPVKPLIKDVKITRELCKFMFY